MDNLTNNIQKQNNNEAENKRDVNQINEYIHEMKLEIDLLKKLIHHIDTKMLS